MFGVDTSELIIIAIAALIFIGPKDLPKAMSTVGRWIGQIRGMARHFHSGIETMIRESELEEMEKTWREENDRIMREYPALLDGQRAEAEEPQLPLDTTQRPAPEPLPEPSGARVEDLPPEQRDLP
jgi:sec-independent protein translocase protein TatB